MDLPENALQSAMILDFRLRLENHYKVFLGISPNAAVILDFRGSIWESLQRGMVSAAVVVAATRSVSDSNFRSGKEEWFRL